MKYKFEGKSRQHFTEVGSFGALCFVVGLIVSGISSWNYYAGLARNATITLSISRQDVTWLAWLAGIAAIISLIGFVMMFIGRESRHRIWLVTETPGEKTSDRDDDDTWS